MMNPINAPPNVYHSNYANHPTLEPSSMSQQDRGPHSRPASSRPFREQPSVGREPYSCSLSVPFQCSSSSTPHFPLPNYVEDEKETGWGPAGEPKKAAGDISLTGKQIMPFLVKCSMKLTPMKTQGVQLRFQVFERMVDEGKISELCIRKFNFVVDALDRGNYREAGEYFEQCRKEFPNEVTSDWAKGVELMIMELKPTQLSQRVGSASGFMRTPLS